MIPHTHRAAELHTVPRPVMIHFRDLPLSEALSLARKLARGRKCCLHARIYANRYSTERTACVDVTLKVALRFIRTACQASDTICVSYCPYSVYIG